LNAALPSNPGGGRVPTTPGDVLRQLVEALERWGELFLRVAHEAAIRSIMTRMQALAAPNPKSPTPNPKGGP